MPLGAKRKLEQQQEGSFYKPFLMQTTSVLYSEELVLKEARSVSMNKSFSYIVCPSRMHFIHSQRHRMTKSLLDSPFVFVQNSKSTHGVDAYLLSYGMLQQHDDCQRESSSSTSTSPSCLSSSSTAKGRITSTRSPTTEELKLSACMKKVEDSEDVLHAYQVFLSSPLLKVVFEDENFEEAEPVHTNKRRDVLIPIPATLACYATTFHGACCRQEDLYRGQLLLSTVCNFPAQRFSIPSRVADLQSLLNQSMKHMRIFNIHVQHNSMIVLRMCDHDKDDGNEEKKGTERLYGFVECNLF